MNDKTGKLFIVSTPIGNLEDITLRALKVLKEVDLIAAEDTRHTRGLLSHYLISKPLTSFNSHNEDKKGWSLISNLINGKNIALVSDAGTPGISDPAISIIRLAIEEGIEVVPIPGVSAAITALSASGLATDRFFFEGFLPRKRGKREKRIAEWKEYDKTVVFYESPYRVVETLKEIKAILGDRKVAVGREMTKLFEEIIRGNLSDVIETLQNRKIKGEFTVIVGKGEDGVEEDFGEE